MRSDLAHIHQASVTPIYDVQRPAWFDDDSEWEYEYHEDETEELYFTLDLTTHLPDALTKRETARNGRLARGTLEARKQKIAARSKGRAGASSGDTAAVFVEQSPEGEAVQEQTAPPDEDQEDVEADPESVGKIQFIGLETANPHIVYNNKFYSTYWLSDIGTQLWISEPGVVASPSFKGHILDVIGLSHARLVARPAALSSRTDAAIVQRPMNDVPVELPKGPETSSDANPGLLTIPKNLITDPASKAHASFMERFSKLKQQRGETDRLHVGSIKVYELPEDAPEIRDRALAAEKNAEEISQRLDNDGRGPILTSVEKRKARVSARVVDISDGDDNDYEDDEEHERSGKRSRHISGVAEKHQARARRLETMGLRDESALPPRRKRRTKLEMQAARARGEK